MLAGMFARLLEAEGLTCRHIGTHFPAEIGVGAMACEQRLEVPTAEVERARELLANAGAADGEAQAPLADDQTDDEKSR